MSDSIDYAAIGRRIREARKNIGITQDKLAETVDLSPSHMSHIESGKTKVSLPSLVLIANALNTSVDSLLHDNIVITRDSFDKDFRDLLKDCSMNERKYLYAATKQLKDTLKSNLE